MPHNLYPDDFAALLLAQAGEKWRPSNGTEGDIFIGSWCATCTNDLSGTAEQAEPGCAISLATFWFTVREPEYPAEWCLSATGQPQCTAYRPKETNDAQ